VPRRYRVAFIGGGNPTREATLLALGDRLDVLVGNFRTPALQARRTAAGTRPAETASIYRQARIVVNIFRDAHQYNREQRQATMLNPRVYEATACGALVVSDWRPALDREAPSVPTYRSPEELVAIVDGFLAQPDELAARAARCRAELAGATYAERLRTMLDVIAARRQAVA